MRERDVDGVAVHRDLADDLAEGQRHDRDVVAPEAQRRQADDYVRERGEDHGDDEEDEEVDVDARGGRVRQRALGRLPADQDVDAVAVVGAGEVVRREPSRAVGPDRVEGDVPQVEQTGLTESSYQGCYDGHEFDVPGPGDQF